MKQVPIFSLNIAQELLNEGFVVVNILHNKQYADKLVFYFNREPELLRYLKEEKGINIKH